MTIRFCSFFVLLVFFSNCQNEKERTPAAEKETIKITQIPNQQELQAVFGKELTTQIADYQQKLQSVSQVSSIESLYRTGVSLRDTLVNKLGDYTERRSEEELPDLFWLKEALPAYVPQVVAEGTAYYLFNDYRQWQVIARQTPDLLDDEFVLLNIQLYPQDSIEYFYPAYFLQTWDYGGSSLLGRGIHTEVLNTLERHWADSTQQLFKKEVLVEKERLLNDILESTEGGYWETQGNILNELSSIISTDYKILTKNEKIALRQRQQQFQKPKKNNILVDVQSGIINE